MSLDEDGSYSLVANRYPTGNICLVLHDLKKIGSVVLEIIPVDIDGDMKVVTRLLNFKVIDKNFDFFEKRYLQRKICNSCPKSMKER